MLKLPLLETKLYTVKDENGELLVSTACAAAGIGVEVRVKGSVDSMAIIGGRPLGLRLKECQQW